jgi:chlorobactene glucosyltransferase
MDEEGCVAKHGTYSTEGLLFVILKDAVWYIPRMNVPSTLHGYFIFWAVVLGVWIYRTYRLLITLQKTPQVSPRPGSLSADFVSVLIPAKNEELNIRACVEALRAQTYPKFELIVINDNSTDKTEAILKSLDQTYINCPPAPEGWTGKNHALHCGAAQAKGEWLLFTDADTRHTPESLKASMAHVKENKLEFLSLLPHCLTGSFSENFIQPIAMAFLGLWFPMEKVNDPASPLYFANGQYLLIHRRLYNEIGGHQAVAAEFLEDFALMKRSKELGARAQCAFGTKIYGTRMYDSIHTIWRGWRRIYLHAFRRNPAALAWRVFSVFCFSMLPFLVYAFCFRFSFFQSSLLSTVSTLTIGFLTVISWRAFSTVRANGLYAVFHPLAGVVISLILLDATRMALTNQRTHWR